VCCSEDKLLQTEVISVLPLVQNVNAMADEMQKPVAFSMMLVSPEARGLDHGRTEVSLDSKKTTTENSFFAAMYISLQHRVHFAVITVG